MPGEKAKALSWLKSAVEECDGWRVFVLADQRTLPFRQKPCRDQLLARLDFDTAFLHGSETKGAES